MDVAGGRKRLRLYREGRFQRVSALLAHGEGSAACQAAQLPPDTLPLQRVVSHSEGKLQEHRKMESFSLWQINMSVLA